MARVEINATVDKVLTDADLVSPYETPMVGASVLVSNRVGGAPATVYGAETGGGTLPNPLTTDANGRIEGWVDPGSYNLQVSGAGITTYTQPYEAVRGDGVTNISVGAIDIAQLASAVADAIFKPGDMKLSGKGSADSGWLLCQGQTVSRTTYGPLFAAISTTFNTGGEAGTDFRLPDFRGRSPVGPDAGLGLLATFNTMGAKGGEATHVISANELPSHTHSLTPGLAASGGAHTHAVTAATVVASGFEIIYASAGWITRQIVSWTGSGAQPTIYYYVPGVSSSAAVTIDTASGSHTHGMASAGAHTHTLSGSTASAGSSTPMGMYHSYQIVQFQIKT